MSSLGKVRFKNDVCFSSEIFVEDTILDTTVNRLLKILITDTDDHNNFVGELDSLQNS